MCKQSCKPNDVARLYFQWGDSSLTQRPVIEREEDSEALRREVRRLEAMALGHGSALEGKEKEVKALNQEVCAMYWILILLCLVSEKSWEKLRKESRIRKFG